MHQCSFYIWKILIIYIKVSYGTRIFYNTTLWVFFKIVVAWDLIYVIPDVLVHHLCHSDHLLDPIFHLKKICFLLIHFRFLNSPQITSPLCYWNFFDPSDLYMLKFCYINLTPPLLQDLDVNYRHPFIQTLKSIAIIDFLRPLIWALIMHWITLKE